jgi:serine protease
MNKKICAAWIAALVVGAYASPSEDQTDQVLIKFSEASPSAKGLKEQDLTFLKNALVANGLSAQHVRSMDGGVHILKLDRFTSSRGLRTSLAAVAKSRADIVYIEPDLIGSAATSDPFYALQWNLHATYGANVPPVWQYGAGSGVTIAIVDTGFTAHEDLFGRTLPGHDFIGDGSVSYDGDGRDANATDPGTWRTAGQCPSPQQSAQNSQWHGTGVASVAAAQTENYLGIAGVAPSARLLPVRVVGACGAYISDTADGIKWSAGAAVAGTPPNANPAKVINISISGASGCPSVLQSAVNAARSLGALVVAAAGNSNTDVSSSWPANCYGVTAVAATNSFGQRWVSGVDGSNFGDGVALAAPGADIWIASDTGTTVAVNSSYVKQSGTSLAAPMVAGAAALMFSASSSLTADDVALILKGTTRPFPSGCSGCGTGIVDASAAVNAIRTGAPLGTFAEIYITRDGSSSSTLVLKNGGSGWITGISARCTQPSSWITVAPPSALGPGQSVMIKSSNGYHYTCGFVVSGNNATNSPYQNGSF